MKVAGPSSRNPLSSHYGDDLAYIHDVGYSGLADGLSPGLLKTLWDNGIRDGVVVDLGCGSGIWAKHLCEAGYQVVGVDISPAMIRLARKRAPEAKFHVESFRTFELPPCRAITALGEVLCYRFDGSNNRTQLTHLLLRAADALDSGGMLIFDVAEVGLNKGRPPTSRESADWACLVRFEYDDARDQMIRHITSFRKQGSLYRRREETHRLQLFRRRDVADMLQSAGFRVRTVRRFGAQELLPGHIGFVARKP